MAQWGGGTTLMSTRRSADAAEANAAQKGWMGKKVRRVSAVGFNNGDFGEDEGAMGLSASAGTDVRAPAAWA